MKVGVIGHPINHSKSPIIHGYWLERYGLSGTYEAIDIAPQSLKEGITKLIDQGYDGFNVTIPHKQNIMEHCSTIDETVRLIGAVNTVRIENKKLYGMNTDAFGFIQNIKATQSDFSFKGKTAVVLGAGGAARAIIYGLLEEGVSKIILINRTVETARSLAESFLGNITIQDWDEREKALAQADILVNTTSLGMAGKPDLDLDLSTLKSKSLVCDIVYVPLMTPLLNGAQEQGHDIVTGIGMLLHQARPAFEAWTGILPEVSQELQALVLK